MKKKYLLCFLIFSFIFTVYIMPSFGASKNQKIDVDLSKLNSMMSYSTLLNIVMNPKEYIGKTIRIKGLFDSSRDSDTGIDYFAVIIMDASACCSMGLDFSVKKEFKYKYPEDYPKLGSNITVTGRFEKYTEGEDVFYHLAEAEIMKN